jgi:hypothetical protein
MGGITGYTWRKVRDFMHLSKHAGLVAAAIVRLLSGRFWAGPVWSKSVSPVTGFWWSKLVNFCNRSRYIGHIVISRKMAQFCIGLIDRQRTTHQLQIQ